MFIKYILTFLIITLGFSIKAQKLEFTNVPGYIYFDDVPKEKLKREYIIKNKVYFDEKGIRITDKKILKQMLRNDAYNHYSLFDKDFNPSATQLVLSKRTPTVKINRKVGDVYFDSKLLDLEGNTVQISDFKGKKVVINYWSVTCRPCIAEIPKLHKLQDKFKNKNVVFLAICNDTKEEITTFLKNKEFNFSKLYSQTNSTENGINAYPTHVVLDENYWRPRQV